MWRALLQKPKLRGSDRPSCWVTEAEIWLQGLKVVYAAFWCVCLSMDAVRNGLATDLAAISAGSMTGDERVIVIKNQKGRMRRSLATSEGAGQKVTLTRITSLPTSRHQCRV